MSDLFWLSDAQMARLEPFFPKSHGKPRVDDRRVLSGIIFINRNGLRWRDAPKEYGPHKTLYNRWKVSARFLPQRLVLDAGDNVWLGDEVVEEAVPLFDGPACGCEHITYLV
ncbi:MAG: transposase, partial [Parvibaculaceae bacterium]